MNESIPRENHPTAAAAQPGTPLVTFCLWWGSASPPQVVGRTAEEADQHLLAHLTRYFTEDAEAPSADPDGQARHALGDARAWGLSLHVAPDERAAFKVWQQVSMLRADEALRRWRVAFPVEGEADPLAEWVLASANRVPRGEAAGQPPAPVQRGYELVSGLAARLSGSGGGGPTH